MYDPRTELEGCNHMQWFAFRSTVLHPYAAADAWSTTYEIVNAGLCSYMKGWDGLEVCVSHDLQTWRRVPSTRYDAPSGTLRWSWMHNAAQPTTFFAYFEPYPYDRQLALVMRCASATAPGLEVSSLGQSLGGREIDVITVGTGPLHAWIIHRQHPGEPQAAFFAEGLLARLLGLERQGSIDGLTAQMLEAFTWHVVPSMNPDGGSAGHLRTNLAGANLNREWAPTGSYEAPSLERSPEVYHVLRAMQRTGVDFFCDVHGDEGLPFCFCAGNEGTPNWGPRLRALHGAFVGAYARANPDMQARFGYEPDSPGGANPAVGGNQVGMRFDCLAVTLEMPFKDNAANAAARRSGKAFDGHRCAMLGASLVDALAHVHTALRGVPVPRFELPDDAYVRPTEDVNEIRAFLDAQARAARGAARDGQGEGAGGGAQGNETTILWSNNDMKGTLWTSAEQREQWYDRSKAYWEWDGLHGKGKTNDGVMSGIGPLHDADIADSLAFITGGLQPIWPAPFFFPDARALDVGAGIGRVAGALLLDLCGEVDLVDGSASHLHEARAALGEPLGEPLAPGTSEPIGGRRETIGRGRVGRYLCSDLQDFVPLASHPYDLIWIQWTTMYLTDADLTRLLRDCREALAPGGVIVLKDNVIDELKGPKGLVDGRYVVDELDASVSRTRSHLLDLVNEAGLAIVASATANLKSEELDGLLKNNGWSEMHPVAMLALRSAEGPQVARSEDGIDNGDGGGSVFGWVFR
ncbi:zinc carboxypeptidase family protein [Chrysochromulina tobinii]|uniref:Alpha N-terminal protein methyltransferase 1 n=1 Tax=Chrysochromulina tobinii TaxID=1460289 RepID=A0A0M0J3I5_9EUKA|nr:zinc carboxypeptidase family protein [Chrysochromulina tobinii]|eukprot:KOO20818.1 zinc carboxypeptidase family protein [Chrysochromulina sp. CCMP291]